MRPTAAHRPGWALAALALWLSGCGGTAAVTQEPTPVHAATPSVATEAATPVAVPPAAPSGSPTVAQPTADPYESLVAESVVDVVQVSDTPDGEVTHELEHVTDVGGPLTFLVRDIDNEWLQVYLPVRPNGSSGWVRKSDVRVLRHRYRIEVALTERRMRVYEGEQTIVDEPIGVGTVHRRGSQPRLHPRAQRRHHRTRRDAAVGHAGRRPGLT